MKIIALFFALLFSTSAFAQSTGDRIAAQLGTLMIQNANLADQVQSLQAKIKELEDKYEPKKAEKK